MKILYLTGAVGVGGVESFLLNLSQMPRVDSYFFLFQDGPLRVELEKRGAKVFLARHTFRLRNPFSWYLLSNEIAGLAKRLGVSCIHSSMAYSAFVGARAAKKAKLPHLWFQHGPVSGWMDSLAGRIHHHGILCNSKYTMEQQKKRCERGPFYVVPLGTPLVEQESFSTENSLRVVMASRAQYGKGPHVFQDAILRLNDTSVQGSLFLASSDSAYEEKIRSKGGLTIFPPEPNISRIFSGQDALVNASILPEAFGLTLIEAMMRGIVPIAPRAWGPLEIIDDGINGLLFEPGNATDLAEKIHSLKDANFRKKLSENARKKAVDFYALEKMYERMREVYKQVLATN